MQRFDKAVCLDNKSAITMCNHLIRYSMDDTVREMRKKEGCGCNVESVGSACGWLRACAHAGWAREHTSTVYAFAVTGTGLMRL